MTFLKKIAFTLTYALLLTLTVLEVFEYVYPHPCVYQQKFEQEVMQQQSKTRLGVCFLLLIVLSIAFFITGLRIPFDPAGAAFIMASNALYLYSFYLIAHYLSYLQILLLTLATFFVIFYGGLKVHKQLKNNQPMLDESVNSGI